MEREIGKSRAYVGTFSGCLELQNTLKLEEIIAQTEAGYSSNSTTFVLLRGIAALVPQSSVAIPQERGKLINLEFDMRRVIFGQETNLDFRGFYDFDSPYGHRIPTRCSHQWRFERSDKQEPAQFP